MPRQDGVGKQVRGLGVWPEKQIHAGTGAERTQKGLQESHRVGCQEHHQACSLALPLGTPNSLLEALFPSPPPGAS